MDKADYLDAVPLDKRPDFGSKGPYVVSEAPIDGDTSVLASWIVHNRVYLNERDLTAILDAVIGRAQSQQERGQ